MKSLRSTDLIVSMIALVLWTACPAVGAERPSAVTPPLKEYRIERGVSEDAAECIECHAKESGGIVADWASSRHAHANITCLDCHGIGVADDDVSKDHFSHDKTPISAIVSPKDCSRLAECRRRQDKSRW